MRIYPFFLPHAGCSYRCLFCNQKLATGRSEVLSPAAVVDALHSMLPGRGDGEVAFYGGSFTLLAGAKQQAYLAAAAPFVAAGRVAGIRLSTRPDALDADQVQILVRSGVTTVEIGCQSFDETVLLASRRGHDGLAAAGAVARLRRAGIRVGLQLMTGLPGADRDEAASSLSRALALQPDFLRIYPTVVLPETELAESWRAGYYRAWSLEQAVDCCADLLWRCRRAGVPVIRLGLPEDPSGGGGQQALAGPRHPAFGQLVRSRLWRRALQGAMVLDPGRRFRVAPAELSDALGHRRSNLDFFFAQGCPLQLEGDPSVPRGRFRVGERTLSLLTLAGPTTED